MQKTKFQYFFDLLLDNIFDIVTVGIALYVVVRHEFKPFTADEIADLFTWVLAVLGLIAISGVWDRSRRMRRIEQYSLEARDAIVNFMAGEMRVSDFLNEGMEINVNAIKSATTIYLLGASLTGTVTQLAHTLRGRLAVGAEIKFIIVDPIDSVLQDMVLRSWADATPEYYKDRIKTVETMLEYIASAPGSVGSVEIGYLPFHPAFGMILVDPNQSNGICMVEMYHHKSAEPNPAFDIKASDDPLWFAFFCNQFNILWDNCRKRVVLGNKMVNKEELNI